MRAVLLENYKKGMISRGYYILPQSTHDASTLLCRKGWEKDLEPIDGEIWDRCLTSTPQVSVSASQKLSHLYLLHRAYKTLV